jgi:glycerophosphoryl diester phosphodiesterase
MNMTNIKRKLEEEHLKKENVVQTFNKKIDIEEEIELISDIFENDEINEIIININTKSKLIEIEKEDINGKDIRKCKYIDKKLKTLIDTIDDDFIYKNINSFILKVNNNCINSNIYEWKEQSLNEIDYIEVLEKEKKIEDELINLLDSKLVL